MEFETLLQVVEKLKGLNLGLFCVFFLIWLNVFLCFIINLKKRLNIELWLVIL